MPRASVALLIGAAVFGGFTIYVWLRRSSPGAMAMILILLAGVAYTLSYALEVASVARETKQMWGDVKYLGICLLPVAWLAFTLQYTGRGSWLSRRLVALLAIEPAAVLLLLAIPATHDLVHVYPRTGERFPFVAFGPVGWLNVAYSYALILVATGLFVLTLSRIGRPYRRQARFVMASSELGSRLTAALNSFSAFTASLFRKYRRPSNRWLSALFGSILTMASYCSMASPSTSWDCDPGCRSPSERR